MWQFFSLYFVQMKHWVLLRKDLLMLDKGIIISTKTLDSCQVTLHLLCQLVMNFFTSLLSLSPVRFLSDNLCDNVSQYIKLTDALVLPLKYKR